MNRLLLSNCTDGAARIDVPEQLLDAPVPPGWAGENGLPTRVSVLVLMCEHLSLGRFERGPIQMVLESHGKFRAPMNCRVGDYDFLNILTRLIFDDPEVAQEVHETLGIPTSVGNSTRETIGSSTAAAFRFAWTADGGGESWMRIERADNAIQDALRTYRLVWPADGRLGLIDLKLDARQTQFEPTAIVGSFAAPMLIASTGLPLVAGVGVVDEQIFPEGQFRFYEGYECATEIPW